MRILVIHHGADLRQTLAELLKAYLNDAHLKVDVKDGRLLDHEDLLRIAAAQYDVVLLPLELPYFLAFRLAEILHLKSLKTRTVVMAQNAVRPALLGLFDEVIATPFEGAELALAVQSVITRPLQRLPNPEHTEAAVLRIFAAGCYTVIRTRGGAEMLKHYHQTFYPYFPFRLPPSSIRKLEELDTLTPVNFRRRIRQNIQHLLDEIKPVQLVHTRLAGHYLLLAGNLPIVVAQRPVEAERILQATECATTHIVNGTFDERILRSANWDLTDAGLDLKALAPRVYGIGLDILKTLDRLLDLGHAGAQTAAA